MSKSAKNKSSYKPSPAEETLYKIFQEGRKFVYTLRDADCEVCNFGAMAVVVAVQGMASPVSVCAGCGHVQKMARKEARERGLTFKRMDKSESDPCWKRQIVRRHQGHPSRLRTVKVPPTGSTTTADVTTVT